MSQLRKIAPAAPPAGSAESTRPFTARSVVASTLLGVDPPRLPTRLLVRSGELFGISSGTTRVALSRMVAAGELEVDGDGHRLAGRLLDRQARQQASRAPSRRRWDGRWRLAVVLPARRPARARAELRQAMAALRLAERREGLWMRPDNLDESWAPGARAVLAEQCQRFRADPDDGPDPDGPAPRAASPRLAASRRLATQLWDLDGWAAGAVDLRDRLGRSRVEVEAGRTEALAPAFVLSSEVLRHLLADPLLPAELLAPDWPGDDLRADYDGYDAAFKRLWRDWFRRETAPTA